MPLCTILIKEVYKDKSGNEMPYVINTLADTTIEDLPGVFKTLTVAQLFKERTNVLSLVPAETTIDGLPKAIEKVVTEKSINELEQAGVITINSTDAAKLTVEVDHDGKSETAKEAVGDLTINQLFDYCFDLIVVPPVSE